MKFDLKKALLWFGLPLLLLFGADVVVGKFGASHENWFPATIQSRSYEKTKYLMVGSSRVAAAVAPEPDILNLGQGYSTTALHLLGLQRILDRDPNAFKGKLVCIEAPAGLPEYIAYEGGVWIHPESPALIGKVVTAKDLPQVWRSDASSENKWQTTLRLVANKSHLFRYKELFVGAFTTGGTEAISKMAWSSESGPSGLSSAGGIKTDEASQQTAIRVANEYLIAEAKKEKLLTDWDASCVGHMVKLVREHGGSVIFFETPLHSQFQAFYDRPIQQENRAAFAKVAAGWNTPILKPEVRFSDEDFPDVWHLSSGRAPDFTAALMTSLRPLDRP